MNVKKLCFKQLSELNLNQSKEVKGGNAAWTGGCSDGCPSFLETSR
ncbi:hypothetical protein BN1088_1910009 [Sphingobacterium sp. PM2-P1-29]|jgi:hypothetical protein|nr:hypothetical protein BN1088_1910009 [Sphingobacterium sp. PM2-P1-29]